MDNTKENNKTAIKFGIIALAMIQGGNLPLIPALGAIREAMPDTSPMLIQSLLGVQCLFISFAPIFYYRVVERISKRKLMLIGIILYVGAGIAPYFFHSSIYIMLIFRAFLGIGNGLIIVLGTDLVVDFFDGHERDKMQGNISIFSNVAGIIYQVISGFVIKGGWKNCFLVYLIALLYYTVANVLVPEPKRAEKIERLEGDRNIRAKLDPKVLIFAFMTIMVFIAWMTGTTNMAIVLTEERMGSTAQIGMTTALSSVGGFVSAIFFGRIQSRLHHYTILLSYVLGVAGFTTLYFANVLPIFGLGALMVGGTLGLSIPATVTKVTEMVPYSAAPKAISTITFSVGFGQFLQPALFYFLGDTGFGRTAFFTSALLLAVLSIAILIILKKIN